MHNYLDYTVGYAVKEDSHNYLHFEIDKNNLCHKFVSRVFIQ